MFKSVLDHFNGWLRRFLGCRIRSYIRWTKGSRLIATKVIHDVLCVVKSWLRRFSMD